MSRIQSGVGLITGIPIEETVKKLMAGAAPPRNLVVDRPHLHAPPTVDDVRDAINTNSAISVTASVSGDAIKLTDTSGGSGNLRVQNVGDGTTATGLGLASINVAASTATGSDVF